VRKRGFEPRWYYYRQPLKLETVKVDHGRPQNIAVGCLSPWPRVPSFGAVSRAALQILAKTSTATIEGSQTAGGINARARYFSYVEGPWLSKLMRLVRNCTRPMNCRRLGRPCHRAAEPQSGTMIRCPATTMTACIDRPGAAHFLSQELLYPTSPALPRRADQSASEQQQRRWLRHSKRPIKVGRAGNTRITVSNCCRRGNLISNERVGTKSEDGLNRWRARCDRV
jgi:hypothetical protein